jgi:pimeloyl-ACP methyl ester carboxylesterase
MSVVTASSIVNAASGCDGFLCCVGCMSLVPGLVKRVVNQVAFFPPKPAGYHITDKKQVYLVGPECGLSPLPDLSTEGIVVDTVKMWTQRGNTIMGFHFRRLDADRTILFSHGNSTDIGIMFHHLRDICNHLKVDVFAYEYSGYGESTGVPSEADLYADIDAAYHYLTSDCSLDESNIILYGQSVGSVPSIDLASRSDIGGMVLHGALKSGLSVIHDVQAHYWFDVFQNAAKIEYVHAPIFCVHGTHDSEVPFEHGLALFEGASPEFAFDPWWVKGAGHNDIEIDFRKEYFERLNGFLDAVAQHHGDSRNNKRSRDRHA